MEQPKLKESTVFKIVDMLKDTSKELLIKGRGQEANLLLAVAKYLLQDMPDYERQFIRKCVKFSEEKGYLTFDTSE